MKNFNKYSKKYILPPDFSSHEKNAPFVRDIKPPLWCSVDLRDGNQALPVPMTAADKLRFFDLLVEIGFREIEISYPAASKEEWNFTKELSAGGHIQGDVLPQVITMMRPDIINRTFDAIEDMSRIIVNMYNPVSVSQLKILGQSEKDAIMLACENAKICAERAAKCRGEVIFEYTPESFSGAEPRFALEISERVLEILAPTPQKKAILNLPATLENSTPYIYAAQVDYINRNLKNRGCVTLSLHTHNDRGCAVADCETGLIFGGERVEGTLFGNGERTGNADIVTLALNMYSQGIDPGLDFSRLPYVASVFEEITGMHVPPRQPYDAMVFCLFGGTEETLAIAARQCGGTALVVRRDFRRHQFSSGVRMAGHTAADMERELQRRGLTYTARRFTLEFGQPFLSLDDAQAFFRLYSRDGAVPSRQELAQRLELSAWADYPLYLPNPKPLCLLAIPAAQLREEMYG